MTAQTVLAELKSQGIDLIARDGKLLAKPPVPSDFLPAIKEHRSDLIELLESDDQTPVIEDDFMVFFQRAIHEISDFWNGREMPEPSEKLAAQINTTEDRLNLAVSEPMPKADFKGLVERYICLQTHALACSNQGGERSGKK